MIIGKYSMDAETSPHGDNRQQTINKCSKGQGNQCPTNNRQGTMVSGNTGNRPMNNRQVSIDKTINIKWKDTSIQKAATTTDSVKLLGTKGKVLGPRSGIYMTQRSIQKAAATTDSVKLLGTKGKVLGPRSGIYITHRS